VNTSYNPVFFEDEKIPMSVMLQHLIMFYKYGGKQLYYFNTFDGQGEINVDSDLMDKNEELPMGTLIDDEDCEGCTI
jgi:ribonucleoside-diphosphate reductase alpha chain